MGVGEAAEKGSLLKGLLSRIRPSSLPPAGLFAAAEDLRSRGDPEGAAQLCVEGLQHLPNSATGHVVLGEVLWDQGRPELAEREWLTALRLHAEHPRARLRLARLYLERGELSRATSTLECLLLYSPNLPEVEALLQTARRTIAGVAPPRDAKALCTALQHEAAVVAVALVDATGRVLQGGAGIGGTAPCLAVRLLVGAQPLLARLSVGPVLAVRITGTAGEVLCAAAGKRALVAALTHGSDSRGLFAAMTACGVTGGGGRVG